MFKQRLTKLSNSAGFVNLVCSLVSIFFGLIIGLLLMEGFKPGVGIRAFFVLLKGGLQKGRYGLGNILYYMTPIVFTGLSVAFSNQTGIFNMGVSGQFAIGAVTSVLIGGMLDLPKGIHWIVCILASGLMGVIWSLPPAILKAKYDVNEIITTTMTNYISIYTVNELITRFWFNKPMGVSAAVRDTALMPKVGLDLLFPGTNVNIAFLLAIVCAFLVYFLLFRTSFGYGLRAVGFNREAGRYMGINEVKNIMVSMLISGFLAGVGGGTTFLSSMTKTIPIAEAALVDSANAIPAALLGASSPAGVFVAAFFLAYLNCGAMYIQTYGYTSETVDLITSVIIYFSAFSLAIRFLFDNFILNSSARSSGENNANALADSPTDPEGPVQNTDEAAEAEGGDT